MFEIPNQKIQKVQDYFCDHNLTLSLAESLTGGLLSYWLTHLPGASTFFKGSVVSYATEVKIQVLGLDEKFVKEHGVVNKKAAELMAQGVKKLFFTDWSLSITGVAGPNTGELGEKIGQIAFCLSSPHKISTYMEQIDQTNRENIRHQSANIALDFLISELK